MTIFEEIKELVDVPTAARSYGVEVHRGNMALCPFHRERSPSCKLYEDHYYCYGCQAHGDVINLVQAFFGLSPIEAVKQLNSDFRLGLEVDKPPDSTEIDRIRRKQQEREAYEQWEQHAFHVLNDYLWLLRDLSERYAPQSPDAEPDRRFAYALQHISYAEYLSEEYLQADKEEKISMKGR